MKYFLCLFFIAWSSTYIQAQQLTYFPITTYTNTITAIDDYLWIGNGNGLVQLDLEGNMVQVHSVANGLEYGYSCIDYITKDNEGNIYARVEKFIDEKHIIYEKKGSEWQIAQKYSQSHIYLLPFTDGHFGYYDSEKQLVHIQEKDGWLKKKINIKWFLEEEDLLFFSLSGAIYLEHKQELWITSNKGVLRFSNDSTKYYKIIEDTRLDLGLPVISAFPIAEETVGVTINSMTLSKKKLETKIYCYNYVRDTFMKANSPEFLSNNILTVFQNSDKASTFVINNQLDTIYEYWHQESKKQYIKQIISPIKWKTNWQKEDYITGGTKDKNGIIWMATHSGNLYKLVDNQWGYISLVDSMIYARQHLFLLADKLVQQGGETMMLNSNIYLYSQCLILNSKNIEQSEFLLEEFSDKEKLVFTKAMSSIVAINKPLLQTLSRLSTNYDFDEMLDAQDELAYAHYDAVQEQMVCYTKKGFLIVKSPQKKAFSILQDSSNKDELELSLYGRNHYSTYTGSFWSNTGYYLSQTIITDSIATTITYDPNSSPLRNPTRGIYEDSKHNIWIQTTKAVHQYNGKEWISFDSKTLGVKEEDLAFRSVFREDKAGNLLLLTKKGLLKWDGEKWSFDMKWKGKLKKLHPEKFWLDDQNNIWLAMLERGLYKINRDQPSEPTVVDSKINVSDLAIDKKTGVVWLLLDYNEGLCLYRPE